MQYKKILRIIAYIALIPLLLLVLEGMLLPKNWRNSLAELLFKKNAFAQAAELYEKNLVEGAIDSVATANYAKTLYKKGEYSAAQDSLKRFMDTEKPGTDLLYDMGNIAFQQENYQAAYDYYKRALLRSPEDYDLKANYELALRKLNQDNPPPEDSKDKKDQEEPQSSNQEDIRNLLEALDQKESLDRQNQDSNQDEGVRNWW